MLNSRYKKRQNSKLCRVTTGISRVRYTVKTEIKTKGLLSMSKPNCSHGCMVACLHGGWRCWSSISQQAHIQNDASNL